MNGRRRQEGQALPLVMLVAAFILAGGIGLFTIGRAHAAKSGAQNAADLAAVSAARRLLELMPRITHAPPDVRPVAREAVRATASTIAAANGARLVRLTWPDGSRWPPTTVQVTVVVSGPVGTAIPASARATIRPGVGGAPDVAFGGGEEYHGPLVYRDGKPICPAVAAAFDVMDGAAARHGVALVVNSGFRSDAEQAVLFARHPDPKWVAPPGRSRHRNATELDVASTPGAWTWLALNASRYGFYRRYAWEPWHYGYGPGCGDGIDTSEGPGDAGEAPTVLPEWVPPPYRDAVIAGARAGGVPPVILAALLQAESGFNPWAVSPAGAQGIAQFMPATARGVGLRNPFDPAEAIPAAGRLLGAHLQAFGSIPLALAAYNAGPGSVRKYGGVPPYAETRAYVVRIMALAGDPTMGGLPQPGSGGVDLVRVDGLLV